MHSRKQLHLGLVMVAIAGLAVILRRLAVRRPEPCPYWLTILLENRYFNAVAGAEALLDRLDLRPGMSVLDAGCGPGRLTVPAARRVRPGGQVTGLDIQPEMLAKAREQVQAAGLDNVRFIQAPLGGGALPAGEFDRATLVTVLGEIPDKAAALSEIFRSLKPGGILAVTEVLPDPHYQQIGQVRRLALAAGFLEAGHQGHFPAYTIKLVRPLDPPPEILPGERLAFAAGDPVMQTLAVPLYFRALESQRPEPLLCDPWAVALVGRLAYDFGRLGGMDFQGLNIVLRSRQFDRRTADFLARHPQGVVVELGCGLDTRCLRLGHGRAEWINLDLPEVMAVRRQLLATSPRCTDLAGSVFDRAWLAEVPADRPLLFVAEGLFMYFPVEQVRELVRALAGRFPGAELLFDGVPHLLERNSRLHPLVRRANAPPLRWGMTGGREPLAWHPDIRLLDEWFYYDEPEPRLGLYRWLRHAPVIGRGFRIVHYHW